MWILILTMAATLLFAGEETTFNKFQIAYLMQTHEVEKSLNLYDQYRQYLGKNDFEMLEQMAHILLEEGARSEDQEKQLMSIYGSGVASVSSSLDVLEAGIKSSHPETQLAAIQFLGRLQDDRSDELLIKAMSSNFFFARMEAALQLAGRKHPNCVGQIEALMYRIPPEFRFFFPQFFALIGTSDAITILRQLIEDGHSATRVEAISCAARLGRDDLLPIIRASITHTNIAEQEASAFALGIFKDSKSIHKLKKLKKSNSESVRLAAYRSLYALGDLEVKEEILAMAKERHLFAIAAAAEIPEAKELLATLAKDPVEQVRLNAAMSLLKLRDGRCLKPLIEILIRDGRDLGFAPQVSLGKSHLAWKVVPSAKQQQQTGFDIASVSIQLKEQLLKEALELPEQEFLFLAKRIFDSRQNELIPLLTMLLENLQTAKATALLKEGAMLSGAPLIRGYCNLVLFRMKKEGPYKQQLMDWVSQNKKSDMIRFRPIVQIDQRLSDSPLELTPEDSSKLLIDAYQALADRHDEIGINFLLDSIKEGNPKNRYVLAGLLLRALQ